MSKFSKMPLWALKLLVSVGLFVVFGGGYLTINRLHLGFTGTTLETFIDKAIPFDCRWVWLYYAYYPAIFLPFIFMKERKALFRAVAVYSISAIITLAFFAFWRTEMVRPDVVGCGVSNDLIARLYETDMPYNCFPSQHVAYIWSAAFVSFGFGRVVGLIAVVTAVLVSLSTLFIKQHWFLDVVGGFIVAGLAALVIYRPFLKKKKGQDTCT